MLKSVEILFNEATTNRIKKVVPEFTGTQKFKDPLDVDVYEGCVLVNCKSLENPETERVEYFYPMRDIERIKVVREEIEK